MSKMKERTFFLPMIQFLSHLMRYSLIIVIIIILLLREFYSPELADVLPLEFD